MLNAERAVRTALEKVGLEVNGKNPWDPQMKSSDVFAGIVARGSIGLGEAYMQGRWECEDLVEFFARTTGGGVSNAVSLTPANILLFIRSVLTNRQSKRQALSLGRFHYDIPREVWEGTLDSRMTGSCAYYRTGAETLDEAQEAKIDLTLRKADIGPGKSLLDIGVGWGAFSGYAADKYSARPIGVTVSGSQRDYIRQRYGDAVDVRVHDYRDTKLSNSADAVISAEMFEHVGSDNFRTFFEVAHRSLRPEGRMVLHTIVGHTPSKHIDPWMDKYIYPGGCLPTPGQICSAVQGLFHVEDVHDIGAHYDRTLIAWMSRFDEHRVNVKALGKKKLGMDPEVFCRMWKYHYLASAGGFRSRTISVHQYVLSRRGIPGGLPPIR
jgi:cyclopropane-fatty-acyl-phospholipid synthase